MHRNELRPNTRTKQVISFFRLIFKYLYRLKNPLWTFYVIAKIYNLILFFTMSTEKHEKLELSQYFYGFIKAYCFYSFTIIWRNSFRYFRDVIFKKEYIECSLRGDLRHMKFLNLEKTDYILMTDIKNSSNLFVNYEKSMWNCLKVHYTDADKLIEEENGILVDTEGDSCICIFKTLQSAINFGNKFMISSRNYKITEDKKIDLRCVIHQGTLHFKQLHNYIYCFGDTKSQAYEMLKKANVNEISISDTILQQERNIASQYPIKRLAITEMGICK